MSKFAKASIAAYVAISMSGVQAIEEIKRDIPQDSSVKPSTTVSVNEHKIHDTYEDADHDIIEDYSEDKELEAAEKEEAADELKPIARGNGLDGIFEQIQRQAMGEDNKPDDYTEETVDAQGRHITKKVHKGPGFTQVEVTSDGPMDMGSIIGQMLQQQMAMRPPPMQMRQISSPPPFIQMMGPSPIDIMRMIHDEEEDQFEDPFEVIAEIERSRRRPQPIFSSPYENVQDDHALAEFHADGAATKQDHVHNDIEAHSPFYMFMVIVMIAAMGFALWFTTLRDSSSSLRETIEDLLNGKTSKRDQNYEHEASIPLSGFNKKK